MHVTGRHCQVDRPGHVSHLYLINRDVDDMSLLDQSRLISHRTGTCHVEFPVSPGVIQVATGV